MLAVAGALVLFGRGAGNARAASTDDEPAVRPAARPAPVVHIAAVGDVTFGWDASRPSDEGVSLLAGARSLLDGDVVVGNLETTLTDGGSAKCGEASTSCYAFRAPPSFTRGLARAGFTTLNLA